MKLILSILLCLTLYAQSPLYSPSTVPLANAGTTGTTASKLVKCTSAPCTAVIAGTGDTTGVLGIAVSGAGTSGNVLYAPVNGPGLANCVFDGGTTANHLVIASTTTGGDCHDSGVAANGTCPSVQVIGVVQSTNASGGTYAVALGSVCPGAGSSASAFTPTTWWPNGFESGAGTATPATSTQVNGGSRTILSVPFAGGVSFNNIRVTVSTGINGSFSAIGIYNIAGTSLLCQVAPFSTASGTGTVTEAIASGPCVLPQGQYYVVTTGDNTGVFFLGYLAPGTDLSNGNNDAGGQPIHGRANSGCISSGSGSGITFNSSIASCTWTYASTIVPLVMLFKQ